MISKFFKKWGVYIAYGFTAIAIVIFLAPHLFMGDDAIERAHLSDVSVFIATKKNEIQDDLMNNYPIKVVEETPNWNHVKYFYRSSEGAMYVQTDKRAYFLVPIKNGNVIEWECHSSDGSILLSGCTHKK